MTALSYSEFPHLYSVFTQKDEIQQACVIAARARLAVNTWSFFEIFRDGRNGDESQYRIKRFALCLSNVDGKPLGCAVSFWAWDDFNAGCFVKATNRRQGIGSMLIQSLLSGESESVRIHHGVDGSMDFWRRQGANELDYIRER